MKGKKTTGMVGNLQVTAYEYYGKDYGLSHYRIHGDKSYMGTAEFTTIHTIERIK